MLLEVAVTRGWSSVPLRGRLGLLSSLSASLIKGDLNEDSWLWRGGQPDWVKEDASANKLGVKPYRENHHNRLPLFLLRGLMYRREGPGGFVKDIPLEGALERKPDGEIKTSWDQCDRALTVPLVTALLFWENMSSLPSYTLCLCCVSVLNVSLYMQNVKTNKECCFNLCTQRLLIRPLPMI